MMLDFSFAAGLDPIWSSFSRNVFSCEMILRVAMVARVWLCFWPSIGKRDEG